MNSVHDGCWSDAAGELAGFRRELHRCLTARADVLFELTDARLCTDGPVKSLVGLTLAPEHRRGHGAMYDAVNAGRIDVQRLRVALAASTLPRAVDGRLMLAVDVSAWLRPDAVTSADRLFCHVYGRGRGSDQFIPGWPYSFVAALEPGRTSWTAVLDAVRLGPDDDLAHVTAVQVRAVVDQLIAVGQWQPDDPDVLVVFDAGYDLARLAFLLADLPIEVLGRLRSDRVFRLPAPPGRNDRAATQARRRALLHRSRHVAGTGPRHVHRHQPLRHGVRDGLGSVASAINPTRGVVGVRR